MAKQNVFYARYMDDWVILTKSRHQLRIIVRLVNQTLGRLKVEKHPDKTFIGKVERGFDFLGYHFNPGSLRLARVTILNFRKRLARLYEQGADSVRIGQYVKSWVVGFLAFSPCMHRARTAYF